MSYAAITKENREPLSQQPHPDTALLNLTPPSESEVTLPDGDSTKVSVAPADYKEHPKVRSRCCRHHLLHFWRATTCTD